MASMTKRTGQRMNTYPMPAIGDIESLIARMRLGIAASELHGSMTGYLCAGGQPGPQGWLDALQLESADASLVDGAQASLDALLLLPDAEGGLESRALGLVDWCRGFLGGFGLGGVDADNLGPGMADILRDFSDIAATVPEMGEDEEDEAALNELIDHVCFGALLLHTSLTVPEDATRQ